LQKKIKSKKMGMPFTGSINYTELVAAAKKAHSAFVRAGKKNNVFINVTLWENDNVDEFGNTHSLQLNPKENAKDNNKEGRIYLGNFKPKKKKEGPGIRPGMADNDDDLPF
jgi:hypothetical protein